MKNFYKNIVLLFVALVFSSTIKAQDLVGTFGNYSGSRSVLINPAGMISSNIRFDVGIGGSLSFYNDFMFFNAADLDKYIFSGFNKDKWPTYDLGDNYYRYKWYKHAFNYKHTTNDKNLEAGIDANVFSAMWQFHPKHAIGVSYNSRFYMSGHDVPYEIAEMIAFSLREDAIVPSAITGQDTLGWFPRDEYFKNFKSSGANVYQLEWSELGISYAGTVLDDPDKRLDVGATAKYLIGYSGGALKVNNLDYTVKSVDSTYVQHTDTELAYAYGYDYDNKGFDYFKQKFTSPSKMLGFGGKVSGTGFGVDLGVVFTKKRSYSARRRYERECQRPALDYKWKIGASILDLGFIKFNKNATTREYKFDAETGYDKVVYKDGEPVIQHVDTVKFNNNLIWGDNMNGIDKVVLTNFFNELSYYCYGDSTASVTGTSFTMGLPTALSLQFDANIVKNYYIGAIWVQPIHIQKYQVDRAAQLLLTPRYETRKVDVTIPVSLVNYNKLYLGLAFRYDFFTIGSQNFLSLCGVGETYGMDIYVGFKFNLYKGHCYGEHDACYSYSSYKKRRR